MLNNLSGEKSKYISGQADEIKKLNGCVLQLNESTKVLTIENIRLTNEVERLQATPVKVESSTVDKLMLGVTVGKLLVLEDALAMAYKMIEKLEAKQNEQKSRG